jgi:hypothetical protein
MRRVVHCRCRHPFFQKNLPLELQTLMQDQGAAYAAGATQHPQQSLQDLMLVLHAFEIADGAHHRCSAVLLHTLLGENAVGCTHCQCTLCNCTAVPFCRSSARHALSRRTSNHRDPGSAI